MKVDVFNVEHGACALLTCANGLRVMVDCGHNASTGWKPGDYLNSIGVAQLGALFVTNYDEDHVSGFSNLMARVRVPRIFRNMTVSPATIQRLKTRDGMGPGIAHLVGVLTEWEKTGGRVGTPSIGLPANVTIRTFNNAFGEFDDENNLSTLVQVNFGGVSFLFTGDLETAGWKKLIQRADVRAALSETEVFFASHHGRISGCCDEVFDVCKPRFVVISDQAKGYQTQETHAYYHARARGGRVVGDANNRFVLTTRRDGHIAFEMSGTSYTVTTGASGRSAAVPPL